MSSNIRIWILVSAVAVLAVLAGGWFVGAQPQLASADTIGRSAANVDAQNRVTRTKLAALSRAAAKVESMKAENAILLKSVPTILKPNTLLRRIREVAQLNAVSLVSVTPGDATAYTPPASAGKTAASGGAGPAALALGRTDRAITAANLAVVPVSVVVTGSGLAVLQFAQDLQTDERTFAVTSYSTSKAESSATVTGTVAGLTYVLQR